MPLVVGVAFKPVTKVYYFDPGELRDLQPGERVVVDTARGRTLGIVAATARDSTRRGDQRHAQARSAPRHRAGYGAAGSADASRAGSSADLPGARQHAGAADEDRQGRVQLRRDKPVWSTSPPSNVSISATWSTTWRRRCAHT